MLLKFCKKIALKLIPACELSNSLKNSAVQGNPPPKYNLDPLLDDRLPHTWTELLFCFLGGRGEATLCMRHCMTFRSKIPEQQHHRAASSALKKNHLSPDQRVLTNSNRGGGRNATWNLKKMQPKVTKSTKRNRNKRENYILCIWGVRVNDF